MKSLILIVCCSASMNPGLVSLLMVNSVISIIVAPTDAASVGLNTPVSIPPIIIKGIVSGIMAALHILRNSQKDILPSRLG